MRINKNPGMKKQPKTTEANGAFISTQRAISRGGFLGGAGITLPLPLRNSLLPAFAAPPEGFSPASPAAKPRRMFAICNNLGLLPENFFPKAPGRHYTLSPYLEI